MSWRDLTVSECGEIVGGDTVRIRCRGMSVEIRGYDGRAQIVLTYCSGDTDLPHLCGQTIVINGDAIGAYSSGLTLWLDMWTAGDERRLAGHLSIDIPTIEEIRIYRSERDACPTIIRPEVSE